jgi:hypothetical protein
MWAMLEILKLPGICGVTIFPHGTTGLDGVARHRCKANTTLMSVSTSTGLPSRRYGV